MPWKARNAASVTTNDGMPTFDTRKPSTKPMTTPVSSAAGIAVYQLQPWLVSRIAMTAPHTPLAKPADRSISPSSRTKIRPIAIKVTCAPWVNRLAKLTALKNVSRATPKIRQSTIRPRMAGRLPMSPPRTRPQ